MTEIIVSAIAALSAIAVALISAWAKRQKDEKDAALREMRIQANHLDFADFVQDWSAFYEELDHLMKNSNLERFLLFRAFNGKEQPRWTTAVLQVRQGNQEPVAYVHFELDHDYVYRIKTMIDDGGMYFRVNDLPECAIKHIYKAEKITAAYWHHIQSKDYPDGTRKIVYCSFATRKEGGFDRDLITRFKILASRLKGIAETI